MTLPEILALEPAQVRVELAEAIGWANVREQDYCESHVSLYDGPVLQFWQGIDPDTGYKDEIPQLTLDTVAQAVAGLTDEEHTVYRSELWKISTAHVLPELRDRAYIDATALQRARAFLVGKSE